MADNENDPPRKRPWDKGGRDRDDDDDRPRRRRDEDDDRDDDRPRRRRRDEDDDYDDRPRRRGAAKSGGGTTAAIVIGCGIGGLLLLGLAVALLLPAVSRVRGAAARMKDSNNLKQLSLGTLNYQSANVTFPPPDGTLSWRFHILPYIEQASMYQAMNPREPWDGPTNRRFASTRVNAFVSATDPQDTADTRYRVFVGPNTLFPPGKPPLPFVEITDGLSNTILIVEAGETVPWPQPKELAHDPNGPLPRLGGPHTGVFLVAMADGSVRTVSDKTSPDVIRGGIDPKDGRRFDP